MNALPPDNHAPEPEPVLGGPDESGAPAGLHGFDAELAAALNHLGRKVHPREFDSRAILRRTSRRRTYRALTASAAGLAVVAGVTAFAARPDTAASAAANPTSSASTAAVTGIDPLIVPGYFRTAPGGGAANGFTQFGGTTNAVVSGAGTDSELEVAQTDWTVGGVAQQAEVEWSGDTPQTTPPIYTGGGGGGLPNSQPAFVDVGKVNGRSAYYNGLGKQLVFWTGAQGYATATIFRDSTGEPSQSTTAADLLQVARSMVTTPAAAPMPIRVTGLDGAKVTYAGVGWIAVPDRMKSAADDAPWSALLNIVIDGREYDISASPGPAVTPSPTGTFTSSGLVAATKMVNGLGLEVTTSSGKSGSPSAPTAAQVLAHVSSLGVAPSGWSTSVMVQ